MRTKAVSLLLCTIFLIAGCVRKTPRKPSEAELLKAKLEQQQTGDIVWTLYEKREFRPVWFAGGQQLPLLQQLLLVLNDPSHGVDGEAFRPDTMLRDEASNPLQLDIDLRRRLHFDAAGYSGTVIKGRFHQRGPRRL